MQIREVECKDVCRAQEDMGKQCCYYCMDNKECESQNRCIKSPEECGNSNL